MNLDKDTLSAIANLQSGFPFTPQLGYNPTGSGDTRNPVRPNINPNFHGNLNVRHTAKLGVLVTRDSYRDCSPALRVFYGGNRVRSSSAGSDADDHIIACRTPFRYIRSSKIARVLIEFGRARQGPGTASHYVLH